METIVSLKSVVKEYNTGAQTFRALQEVSLDIERGKFVCILGPSGAGKSTLLNLIGGMDNPTSGNVVINGSDITRYNEDQLSDFRAENIGFIFQFYNILPSLTVLENVELVKDIVRHPVDAEKALEAVGLLEHKNKYPSQLSGGEQQRVSIARAIAKDPALMLCDEPTGALDSQTGVRILKLLKEQCVRDSRNTVIIVTHNSLIADIADVVIRLKNGKVASVTENPEPMAVDNVAW
jgi:putative ABC transport system ATP-binding protein